MKADKKVLSRLTELIDRGKQIENTKQTPPPGFIGFDSTIDSQLGNQWHASARSILANAFGKESEHFLLFEACFTKGVTYSPLRRGIGILNAALEDYENGYAQNVRNLVMAELFSDLLDQAEELLESGYFGPAAVLAGAVLEDNLRKLCSQNQIVLSSRPKLDSMNAGLAKKGIYNKLTQKRITAIADIRNSAAHGKWSEFTKADVKDMIAWIAAFTEEHMG